MQFCHLYHLAGASPLPLDVVYLFLVGSNILQLKIVQQWVVVLKFSQEKMSLYPSTPPSYTTNATHCQKSPSPRWSLPHCNLIWRWRSNSRQRSSSSTEGQEAAADKGMQGIVAQVPHHDGCLTQNGALPPARNPGHPCRCIKAGLLVIFYQK